MEPEGARGREAIEKEGAAVKGRASLGGGGACYMSVVYAFIEGVSKFYNFNDK